VRHGEPYKREESLDGPCTASVCYRPLRYDVLVYEPAVGELRINARSVRERDLYRTHFGHHVFGDPHFFPGDAKYSLDPLLRRGEPSLVCTDVAGLEWVRLREVHVFWGGAEHAVEIHRTDNVFRALDERGVRLPETARLVRGQFHEADRDPAAQARQTGIVAVRNTTGFALPRFAVLTLSEPIIGPQDNLDEFQTRVTFEGNTPYDPIAAGRFAVLLDPLGVNAIGRGVVAGVTPVKVIVDPDHLYDFAEMEQGNTLSLRNAPAESARVLWLEESGSTEQWTVVRLGDAEDVLRFQLLESLSRCGSFWPSRSYSGTASGARSR